MYRHLTIANNTMNIQHFNHVCSLQQMQKQEKFEEVSELDKAFIADQSKQPLSDINSEYQYSISTISRGFTRNSKLSFEMDRQFQEQLSIQKSKRGTAKRRRNVIEEDLGEDDSTGDKYKNTMTKKLVIGKGKTQNIVHNRNSSSYYLRPRQNTKYIEESSSSSSNRQLRQMVDQI